MTGPKQKIKLLKEFHQPGYYSPVSMLLNDANQPECTQVHSARADIDDQNGTCSITHDYSFQSINSDKPSQYPLVQDFSFSTQVTSDSNELQATADAEKSAKVQLQKVLEKYQLINDYSFAR